MRQAFKRFTAVAYEGGERSYILSPEKAKRVDFAIQLGKPLLVEGEAGCGKTQLAYAVAAELGLGEPIVIPVRSSSRVNDMFYRFDALRRLQDSHIPNRQEMAAKSFHYVTLEPLGEAMSKGQPKVVLIDEIDKGDMDFQNDLLFALERFRFPIDEIPASESAEAEAVGLRAMMRVPDEGRRPIIIFTSNREKPLPKPFLRRCIFLELTFPDKADDLVDIVEINLRRRCLEGMSEVASLEDLSRDLISKAVKAFVAIRTESALNNALKKPATAELIDWLHVLHLEHISAEQVYGTNPPYWDLLFKSAEDQEQQRKSIPPGSLQDY